MTKNYVDETKIMAALLLRFGKADSTDVLVLEKELNKKNMSIHYNYNYSCNFGNFTKVKNDTLIFKGFKNKYYLDEIKSTLTRIAGQKIIDIINEISDEEFAKKKEEYLKCRKLPLIKLTNVLLITTNEEFYNSMKKYGFERIDFFKSRIRANEYFKKNPDEINKYHIIIEGDHDLDNYFNCSMIENKKAISYHIWKLYTDNYSVSSTYTHLELMGKESVFDCIVNDILKNSELLNEIMSVSSFTPIKEYINPVKLPLPKKKSDIKILFLGSYMKNLDKEMINLPGLDIEFHEDNNPALERNVINNLGKYDIIIASHIYSCGLIHYENEAVEQFKDTGRTFSILATYDDTKNYSSVVVKTSYGTERVVFGTKVSIDYNVAGNNPYVRKKEYILPFDELYENKNDFVKSIIEVVMNIYNEVLVTCYKSFLSDFDLKADSDYNKEYEELCKTKVLKNLEEIRPIKQFDEAMDYVYYYVNNPRLFNRKLRDLIISKTKDGICIENIYNGRILCKMIIPEYQCNESMRLFTIQTVSKKGNLGNPEKVALYTSKYEGDKSVPKRPNEKQLNTLNAIYKKIKAVIEPLTK